MSYHKPGCYNDLQGLDEIRLVALSPGDYSTPLACDLIQTSLAQAPAYEALSYVWGSNTFNKSVLCNNNHSLQITPNLYSALKQLRLPQGTRWLWIDQVSINQEDLDERSSQVQIMCDIYHGAERVVVWLGEERDDSDRAMDLIARFSTAIKRVPPGESYSYGDLQDYDLPHLGDPVWEALGRLFYRPWFRRIWTIQEIVLAREAIVLCGSKSLDWPILADLMEQSEARRDIDAILTACLSKCPDYILGVRNARHHVQSITTLKQNAGYRHYARGDIAPVLRLFRNSISTDPRDKIWGFLGCFSWEQAKYLAPDYKRQLVDVFTEVAKVAFQDGSLYTLGEAGRAKQQQQHQHTLPSWVADWAFPLAHLSLSVLGEGSKFRRKDPLRIEAMAPLYYAGGELESTGGADGMFPLPGVLAVKTKSLGTITGFSTHPGQDPRTAHTNTSTSTSTSTSAMSQKEVTRHKAAAYKQCIHLASSSLATIHALDTPTSIAATVQHTLIAGLNQYDSKIPWDVGRFFPHWIELSTEADSPLDDPLAMQANQTEKRVGARAVDRALALACGDGASFAMLDYKFFGVVPFVARVGDEVVVVSGAPVAYVVRAVESQHDRQTHELVGEAYVYGVMDGELMADHEVPWQDMWLV